jgi:hypothetical protein
MNKAQAILLLSALAYAPATQAAWQRLSSSEKAHVENATSSIKGTRLVSSKGIGQAQSIISDDPTLPASIPVGSSEATIDIGRQTTIHLANFVNDGIEGKASISASNDKQEWTALTQAVFAPADRVVSMRFASIQAKYLRVQFELVRGGTLRHFAVYGSESQDNFAMQQSDSGGVKVNLASGIGGARVIYIHPSPSADLTEMNSAIDFPESDEKFRTVIYDLGASRTLTEFGSVHSPRPVRFAVFAFNELPEKQDWRGRLSFDPKTFDVSDPVAQGEDTRGLGYIKVRPGKPVKARFVALRWEPDFNPPNFTVGGAYIGAPHFNQANPENQGGGTGGGEPGGTVDPTNNNNNPNNPGYGYGGGISPFGATTGGYAGGGGSLPNNPGNGNALGGGTRNRPIRIPPGQSASP